MATNSYVIKSQSVPNIQLEVGTANLISNLTLMGRNYTSSNTTNGYGQALNQNFVSLAENFASSGTFGPNLALQGQLWYDVANTSLKMNISNNINVPNWRRIVNEDTTITKINNGTTSVDIPVTSGNIVMTVGNVNTMNVTSSGTTITGTLSTTGNITINGGVLVVPGTSRPPLQVDSTQMVTNLNSQYVGGKDVDQNGLPTAGTVAWWQPGGTLIGNTFQATTFTGGNFNGNFIGNGSGLTGVVAGSSNTAVTVTGNAQPNITSTGTLVGLGVNGTITAVDITANTGIFTGNGFGLNYLQAGNIIGAVAFATVANSVAAGNVVGNVAVANVARTVAGANVTGTVPSAATAATVTTAAQPNITSLGTLTSLNVTGNIAANVIYGTFVPNAGTGAAGILFPDDPGGGSGDTASIQYYAYSGENTVLELKVTNDPQDYIRLNATGGTTIETGLTVNGGTTVTGTVTASGFTTAGSLIATGGVRTTSITTGAVSTAGTITGNWTLTSGSRLQSTYADLAEYYSFERTSGLSGGPGTVVEFGGNAEIRVCDTDMSSRVAGVISTNPAYIMNDNNGAGVREPVALQGRVPCKVIGKAQKGDMMVSAGGGYARAEQNPKIGTVIGKSLENKDSEQVAVIEVAVGRL